ncbi:basic helix-loop-helix and HMG box domain-containing protein 1 isoform X2 [Heterocephalus glaber]|uniref:Basic helix-loop-helix and HMG box domain-containing protein 1 isoform X2 n=1 Tax=Heterocephalus glaber TaxID=10181 RepID=A0AAX6S1G6_HETGA|nr:basic helix-loop-helix and HMG box domain-containing protein 1 isoform X2 [Heterocephalus glaber]
MLGSSGHLCSLEQPRTSSLGPGDRNRKKSHTSQLQELALLIPVTLKTGSKKLTKKEILLHVLHYIQYLQRTIDVVKALLKIYLRSEEGGLGGLGWNPATGPARQRHSTPSSSPCCQNSQLWGACQKPQKKQLTQAELETWPQKSRSSLALDTPKKLVISSDQKEENMGRTTTSPRCPDACDSPKAVLSSQEGNADGEAGAQLMLLDMTKDIDFDDITSSCCTDGAQDDEPDPAFEDESRGEMTYFLSETLFYPSQQVVFYDSSEEVDNDADPWLPVCTPEGSSQESLLALPPPQVPTWSVTGHPDKILGLSPSLFSSPSKLLPEQILEDDTMFLTQGLFEEVLLDSESPPSACVLAAPQEKDSPSRAPEVPPDFYSLCQSSVFLDHCYLSLSDNSKALSSPSSEDTDTDSLWEQEEDTQADPEDSQSSNDEDDDYTWTPSQRASTLPAPGRRARKGPASKGLVKPKESKKAPCPTKVKKKCVNGFIMFCRMNRKPYIRACPGTASTAATRELARLWRVMTQKERRPYCTKARRFSRQHNRIVKQDSSNSENEDWETPKPFYQLLAEKARVSSDLASAPPPHRD